ncbi:MAG: glycosyltransferase [Pseudomonadales bacterium]|jgi:glycosyltransferase involved in cell wall biosynthesis|nr:glycosyltransferase [Pseudomonadales bacterium]
MDFSKKKVAIVHDYLAEYGGAERVVEALARAFPKAPIYVGFVDWQKLKLGKDFFSQRQIRTTYLQKIPFIKKIYSPLRILAPHAFSKLKLDEYDIVISSTNAYFAKAVRVKSSAKHFCYCHTPARSLYGYNTKSNWRAKRVIGFFGQIINHFLRIEDFKIATKIDYIIANSQEVQRRIEKFWRRSSKVINPPALMVDIAKEKQLITATYGDYYIYVNRLNFVKHPELAIEACRNLNKKLIVVGDGELYGDLQRFKSDKIIFKGKVSDEELIELYVNAKAMIYPATDEDFGIGPVEAMAFGLPVIAHFSGGPKETILEKKTGIFFEGDLDNQKQHSTNVKNLEDAIKILEKISWSKKDIVAHAQKYSEANFIKNIKSYIEKYS